jgi:hypothetical protein
VANFEHDTARPGEGYAAPQLHTHSVIFNVTERENGQTRSLQPRELYASQHYATAIYRAELATRLQNLGYEIERGKYGQPEIKGYSREYLEASSLRREQIKDHLREQGLDGAGAAQIAARYTRDRKELLSPEEVQRQHRELAATFGHQADRVVAEARERKRELQQERSPEIVARQAVTYARDHLFEKSAVQDRRALYKTALQRGMGEVTYTQVRQEVELANGKTTPQACKEAEITAQTYYRWRKEFGGLKLDQAKRLKELERENAKLKRLVAELSLWTLFSVLGFM